MNKLIFRKLLVFVVFVNFIACPANSQQKHNLKSYNERKLERKTVSLFLHVSRSVHGAIERAIDKVVKDFKPNKPRTALRTEYMVQPLAQALNNIQDKNVTSLLQVWQTLLRELPEQFSGADYSFDIRLDAAQLYNSSPKKTLINYSYLFEKSYSKISKTLHCIEDDVDNFLQGPHLKLTLI